MKTTKKNFMAGSLLLLMMFSVNSTAYAQEVRRDNDGNYVLSEQAFTDFWAQYKYYQKELESEKELNKRMKKQHKNVVDGLIKNRENLIKENKRLVHINNTTYTKYDVILISGTTAIVSSFIVYLLVK